MSSAAGLTTTAAGSVATAADATAYWCHRCSRVVRVPTREAVVCPHCETGFVELVETPTRRPFPSSAGGGEPRGRRRYPIAAMYMMNIHSGADVGSRRSRRTATGDRSAFNPVIVLRGPSDRGHGNGDLGRATTTFELYYDGGAGSGLRPMPAIMSDSLMGSGIHRVLEQLAQVEINAAGEGEPMHHPASKAAMEAMPTVEIAENHVRLDAHCAVCKDPFELGTEAREMPCKHIFHQDCILPWLQVRNSCPVCRHEMPTDVQSGTIATEPHGDEEPAAGDGQEDAVGLTIWRLPGGGFAVGRFSGGRRAGGRALPVVYTEMDGGLNTNGLPRRVSWASRGSRSRGSGGIVRAFRNFFSFVGRLFGSSSSPTTISESGSSSRRNRGVSVSGESSRRHRHSHG